VRIGAPPFCQLLLEAAAALSPDELDELSEDEDDDEELSLEEDEDPLSLAELPEELELLFDPRASFL
jgi:hypothetical protein